LKVGNYAPTDALIPVPPAYRDLSNMAIEHFSVHCIRRLFEAGVDESNDLAVEFCDKGYKTSLQACDGCCRPSR
jgi:hypothetical protein